MTMVDLVLERRIDAHPCVWMMWCLGSLRIWTSVAAHGIFGVNMMAGSEQGWFGGAFAFR
uniref:Uncharacterized protein n=1 Tax=Oryza glumipatula TaxID=40148 RepID=A0A0D9ZXR7_9ORYZ